MWRPADVQVMNDPPPARLLLMPSSPSSSPSIPHCHPCNMFGRAGLHQHTTKPWCGARSAKIEHQSSRLVNAIALPGSGGR
jgi:hypothetical protein